MTNSVEIRSAQLADGKACGTILQSWLDATPWMPKLHTLDETISFCRDVLIGGHDTHVAGDPVDGFISVDSNGTVLALYVNAQARGKGLGTALLAHVKARFDRLSLWTFKANDAARRFYQRAGFESRRETDGDNEEGLPDVFMTWERAG